MPEFSGALLRSRRESEGLSRTALAVAIGRSGSTLDKYEVDALVPSTAVVGALAAVLDCPVGDLFTEAEGDQARRWLCLSLRSGGPA
jgi:transcriptional regulator with XRE-family HTH domain